MQYTRRDWRNRNLIKTARGRRWLTIPVAVKGRYLASIREIAVSDPEWNVEHWRTLSATYAPARRFRQIAPFLEDQYLGCRERQLSDINRRFLEAICRVLEIETALTWSWEYSRVESAATTESPEPGVARSSRLADICSQAGAAVYVSGPSASVYLQPEPFAARGIAIEYFDYSGYPEYEQLFPPFDHHVSIVDLLFNAGRDARRYLLCAQP
jgi:hypothetical protein